MKFNFKREPVSCPVIDFSTMSDNSLKGFVIFSPSLVSEQLTRTLIDVKQNEIQTISSDIDLLIRMKNGQKIDTAIAEELLNRMSSGLDESLKDVLDKASDEDILDSVRSKYIQTPAQLESYLKSLDSRLADMSSQQVQETIESSEIKPDSVEPVAESTSN